jgi:hypothetical protein
VTVPDPDEQDRRGGAAQSGSGRADPGGTDAAFDEIVAGWRAEPDAPHWPSDADERTGPGAAALAGRAAGTGDEASRPAEQPAEEGHYVPPEPPPMPALRPRTIGGLLLIALGGLLLIAPGMTGLTELAGTPLGLLALAGGIGWLVLGLRQGPPPDSGWDDGAQL